MILFLLLVPMAEIAIFVEVGSRIGAGMTVLLVIISAVAGIWLVRRQGFATATRVQAMIARGESPALGMLEGLALYLRHMGVTGTVIRHPPAGGDSERRPLEGESRRVD
ncbi:MAG: FxsA family protein [Gammaproteobacteria bacterium]|nr:FxsA family protein [Gammaproteobacteria bacterium]